MPYDYSYDRLDYIITIMPIHCVYILYRCELSPNDHQQTYHASVSIRECGGANPRQTVHRH